MAKRKQYTAEFKPRVGLEFLAAQKGLSQASREYGVKVTILSRWKQEFLERAPQLFGKEQADSRETEVLIAELDLVHLPWWVVPGKKPWVTPTGSEKQMESSSDVD